MAVLIAKASGSFTSDTTWGVVDSTSYLNAESSTESLLTTSYAGTRSSAFTPGEITIDGIAVKLCERLGTTGTMSVQLELDSDNSAVSGTEVTINTADLPSALEADKDGGWIFFKFASPVALSAATAYQVAAKTSDANQVDLWCDSTADNLSRCLRTTTNQTPTTGDDLIVTGEKTGAGTETAITVTMNETATTDYGAAPTAANSLILPGLAICDGGTMSYGTSAATNYYLKISNSIIVYSGGVFNIGTTGSPIPRDSTAVLEFDPAADGDYGLTVRNGGTFNSQGLSRTSGKNIYYCKLNTDEAANSTDLGVDTDTGWLDNDEIVVASTTRTASQTEKGALNGNAGASSLTVDGFGGTGGGVANAHSGTSPTQAEIILLTRNVKIRSATSTIVTYLNFKANATVDIDWSEIYYIGTGTTSKRGIEIDTTTGSASIQYSAIHDSENTGIMVTSSATPTISNNVFYLLNTSSAASAGQIHIQSNSVTFSNNLILGGSVGSTASGMIYLTAVGGTISGNTLAGCTSTNMAAFCFGVTGTPTIGTISDNTIHSTANVGMSAYNSSVVYLRGSISNTTIWRSNTSGIEMRNKSTSGSTITGDLVFETLTMFGNLLNIDFYPPGSIVTFNNLTSNGDSTFSTGTGFRFFATSSNSLLPYELVRVNSSSFSVATGIKTAHTNDIAISTGDPGILQVYLNNVVMSGTNEVDGMSNLSEIAGIKECFIKSTRHDQTDGNYKSWFITGVITSDATANMYRTASPSERLTPNNASYKLESGSKKVAVASGQTVTISTYVRESVAGDGTDYNGNRPRLILKRNDAVGITADTVIDTATVSAEGSFEQLTGTTDAATDDGVMEFVVDCDGTTGWINVDDWSAS